MGYLKSNDLCLLLFPKQEVVSGPYNAVKSQVTEVVVIHHLDIQTLPVQPLLQMLNNLLMS